MVPRCVSVLYIWIITKHHKGLEWNHLVLFLGTVLRVDASPDVFLCPRCVNQRLGEILTNRNVKPRPTMFLYIWKRHQTLCVCVYVCVTASLRLGMKLLTAAGTGLENLLLFLQPLFLFVSIQMHPKWGSLICVCGFVYVQQRSTRMCLCRHGKQVCVSACAPSSLCVHVAFSPSE